MDVRTIRARWLVIAMLFSCKNTCYSIILTVISHEEKGNDSDKDNCNIVMTADK
jgi:hypothetical protein